MDSYVESWIKQLEEHGGDSTICIECGNVMPDMHNKENFREHAGILHGAGKFDEKDKEGFLHKDCYYKKYPTRKELIFDKIIRDGMK